MDHKILAMAQAEREVYVGKVGYSVDHFDAPDRPSPPAWSGRSG